MRQANSPTANALLEWLGQPLISTSANISGQPTCHSGIEVFGTMDGRLDLVLDGGAAIGGPSTTVDITGVTWRVIREGTLSERDIADCIEGV